MKKSKANKSTSTFTRNDVIQTIKQNTTIPVIYLSEKQCNILFNRIDNDMCIYEEFKEYLDILYEQSEKIAKDEYNKFCELSNDRVGLILNIVKCLLEKLPKKNYIISNIDKYLSISKLPDNKLSKLKIIPETYNLLEKNLLHDYRDDIMLIGNVTINNLLEDLRKNKEQELDLFLKFDTYAELFIVTYFQKNKRYQLLNKKTKEQIFIDNTSPNNLNTLKRFVKEGLSIDGHSVCSVCFDSLKNDLTADIYQDLIHTCSKCLNTVCISCYLKMLDNNFYTCCFCRHQELLCKDMVHYYMENTDFLLKVDALLKDDATTVDDFVEFMSKNHLT